jgi:glycosyltransferase involved in cell wall biosynthesis
VRKPFGFLTLFVDSLCVNRIVALTVTKNEAKNYLSEVLEVLSAAVDEIVVYDDDSSDETPDVARAYGCRVGKKPVGVPSFLIHEGEFRQAAWGYCGRALKLDRTDWVMVVDADELLLSCDGRTKERLHQLVKQAGDSTGILIQAHECWGHDDDGTPLVRVDGEWGRIFNTRLCRFQPGGTFVNKKMGAGSGPTYVNDKVYNDPNGVYLLHLGYSTLEGRINRSERYLSLNDHGHSSAHVNSILAAPVLERFDIHA